MYSKEKKYLHASIHLLQHYTKQHKTKQMKQPQITIIEGINKLWYHNLRNKQSLACKYYLVVQKYIPLIKLTEKS